MPKKTRHLTVTVDGDERDATWKQGVGTYVEGFDLGKGDTVLIEGTPHEGGVRSAQIVVAATH